MQVTRDTLAATLPVFTELLGTCDFYAVDEEMTGISLPPEAEDPTKTVEHIYDVKRRVAEKFSMIQVGVCLFHKVPDSSTPSVATYVAHPFTFIVYPSHGDEYSADVRARDTTLSPSTVHFLKSHNMDFQRWMYNGMTYCNEEQETRLRKLHAAKFDEADSISGGISDLNELDLLSADEREWIITSLQTAAKMCEASDTTPAPLSGGGALSETVLPLQKSRMVRDVLSRQLAVDFRRISMSVRRVGAVFHTVLNLRSEVETAKSRVTAQLQRERDLVDKLGFRLVFNALVASKKPCVGHNSMVDYLFLLAALDRNAPETLPYFKRRMKELFPIVFDTKYIAHKHQYFPHGRFPQRFLGGYFEDFGGLTSKSIKVTLPLGFEAYHPLTLVNKRHGVAHEAGYDALMTGTVLLNLLAEAGGYDVSTAPKCFQNKIALYHSMYAVDILNDNGNEYLVEDDSIVDVRHTNRVNQQQIDACVQTVSACNPLIYTITKERTLVVLPHSRSMQPISAKELATSLTSRYPKFFEAKVFTPPHLAGDGCGDTSERNAAGEMAPTTLRHALPTAHAPTAAASLRRLGAALKPTAPQLMRFILRR